MFTMFGTIKENNPSGIGLGLCICKQLVNKFGGQINFISKFTQGTTFYFTFETLKCLEQEYSESLEQANPQVISRAGILSE